VVEPVQSAVRRQDWRDYGTYLVGVHRLPTLCILSILPILSKVLFLLDNHQQLPTGTNSCNCKATGLQD